MRPAPPSATPVERVRGERPTDESWHADALAKSRHSRLADQLLEPREDQDLDRSVSICAAVTRQVLQDFAPALILLPAPERRRTQALTAYALTLFDFARQSGLEGERLSQINRWEFSLEEALEGRPPGQPVFVLLASEEQRLPWCRAGFDRLHQCSRRRVAVTRLRTVEAADHEARQLGGALLDILLGSRPSAELESFAAALIRLHGLQNLGEGLRRHQARLAAEELPEDWSSAGGPNRESLDRAVRSECERILSRLADGKALEGTPAAFSRAAAFLRLGGLELGRLIDSRGAGVVESPPRLGLASRLGLLIRCHWRS